MERLLYSTRDVSNLLGCCLHTVWKLIKQGKLQTVKGLSERHMITKESVDKFVNDLKEPAHE